MNPDTGHPSYLELDRAALGLTSPELRTHLDSCEACRAHVHRASQPPPVPSWVQELAAPRPRRAWGWRRGWLLAPALAAVVLVGVVLAGRGGPGLEEEPSYVGIKGAPAVTVYLKRGERVELWDGHTPLLPEDLLRLRVSAAGYRHVTVGTRTGDSPWVTLHASPMEKTDLLLPESWRVDAQGSAEELVVVFSQTAVAEEELGELAARAPQNSTLWVSRLIFPKEESR